MKVTLVLDTEDPRGLTDALKMASYFYERYVDNTYSLTKLTFDKIRLMKVLRYFVTEGQEFEEENPGKTMTNLRHVKDFVDNLIEEQRRKKDATLS